MKPVKKIAAIHDLSGYGRASLTTIIPILSSMELQVCPFPTAVLSSHTAYEGFTFVDLTDTMTDYMNHWKNMDIDFDCIYSGFLGSAKQVDIILEFIDYFKKNNPLVVVDPVMGDSGVLYTTITQEIVKEMKLLVSKADIITPNFTEARTLLDLEYVDEVSIAEIKEMLIDLANLGPNTVIITSAPNSSNPDIINIYAYDKANDKFWNIQNEKIPVNYPGTGDAFTSALIGSLLKGDSLPMAIERSSQFIFLGIKESYGFNYPKKDGILLERSLKSLGLPLTTSSYKEF